MFLRQNQIDGFPDKLGTSKQKEKMMRRKNQLRLIQQEKKKKERVKIIKLFKKLRPLWEFLKMIKFNLKMIAQKWLKKQMKEKKKWKQDGLCKIWFQINEKKKLTINFI